VTVPHSTPCEERNDVSTQQQASFSRDGSAVAIPPLSTTGLSRDSLGTFPRAPVYGYIPQPPNRRPHNPAPTSTIFQAGANPRSQLQPRDDEAMSDSPQIPATPDDLAMGTRAPCIAHVTPETGPISGGTKVTILCENICPKLRCFFGGELAIGDWFSDTAYVCRSPPKQIPGPVDVRFEGMQPKATFTYEDRREQDM
jgi:hypothetical protein